MVFSLPILQSPLPVSHTLTVPVCCSSILSSPRCFYKSFRPRSFSLSSNFRTAKFTVRAAEYKFPDPIPEFAEAETEKFKDHLLGKLSKKDIFGDGVEEVVGICTQIIDNFFHTEYGGPGTLLVDPFMEMAETINERGLPGGPQAARAAIKWAQNHVDNDWKEWTS